MRCLRKGFCELINKIDDSFELDNLTVTLTQEVSGSVPSPHRYLLSDASVSSSLFPSISQIIIQAVIFL
jgi:hypothetical protein